jgi:hypothetical protein
VAEKLKLSRGRIIVCRKEETCLIQINSFCISNRFPFPLFAFEKYSAVFFYIFILLFSFDFNEGSIHRQSNNFETKKETNCTTQNLFLFNSLASCLGRLWLLQIFLLNYCIRDEQASERERWKKEGGINLLDGNIFLAFLWQFLWKRRHCHQESYCEGDNMKCGETFFWLMIPFNLRN